MLVKLLLLYFSVSTLSFPLLQDEGVSLISDNWRLIKLSPTEFKIVSENDVFKLKQEGINFIDVTSFYPVESLNSELKNSPFSKIKIFRDWLKGSDPTNLTDEPEAPIYNYPKEAKHEKGVRSLLAGIDQSRMKKRLTKFSSFWTRYYKSKSGLDSAEWLYKQLTEISHSVEEVEIVKFHHKEWDQFSIVARIRGQKDDIVVVGAHQDSINLQDPLHGRSPGADDDGSGSITILEAFNLLVDEVKSGKYQPYNTIEFQWYAAEEVGLLGSGELFNQYKLNNKKVIAMLQQDMTGFTKDTIESGNEVHIALIQDYVSQPLNSFIKMLFDTYSDIPYHLMSCGYACSDHASARRNGYPSSFMMEAVPPSRNSKVGWGHSEYDVIDQIDFGHMKDHAKLTVAYAYELGLATDLY